MVHVRRAKGPPTEPPPRQTPDRVPRQARWSRSVEGNGFELTTCRNDDRRYRPFLGPLRFPDHERVPAWRRVINGIAGIETHRCCVSRLLSLEVKEIHIHPAFPIVADLMLPKPFLPDGGFPVLLPGFTHPFLPMAQRVRPPGEFAFDAAAPAGKIRAVLRQSPDAVHVFRNRTQASMAKG